MNRVCVWFAFLLSTSLHAQRAFEKGDDVIFEDAGGREFNIGVGHSPVVTKDGKVALVRGQKFVYGDEFSCDHKESKNWISVYDPRAKTERMLFDRALPFERDGILFCIFDQIQLSPNNSTLYLVSPVYAMSGSMAVVDLRQGSVAYVGGVDMVYTIGTGPHRGELVYSRRLWRYRTDFRGEYPYYPVVHAAADGRQIAIITDEEFLPEGDTFSAPILRAYLRKLGGTITVNGKTFP